MKASNVEIVFVIDASASMRPCFEGLANHLADFLKPLQGFNFRIRLGLVAVNVGKSADGGRVVRTTTLAGDLDSIYQGQTGLFTDSPDEFLTTLRGVKMSGDENSLLSLDMALDFPFGPLSTTRRVVAMFSDEKIEAGAIVDAEIQMLPRLIKKIGDRRVMLFAAMPTSEALEILGSTDGSQIQVVEGGGGLGSVDFGKLMGQMAKSISVSSLQGDEGAYERALFGQNAWGTSEGSFEGQA